MRAFVRDRVTVACALLLAAVGFCSRAPAAITGLASATCTTPVYLFAQTANTSPSDYLIYPDIGVQAYFFTPYSSITTAWYNVPVPADGTTWATWYWYPTATYGYFGTQGFHQYLLAGTWFTLSPTDAQCFHN